MLVIIWSSLPRDKIPLFLKVALKDRLELDCDCFELILLVVWKFLWVMFLFLKRILMQQNMHFWITYKL